MESPGDDSKSSHRLDPFTRPDGPPVVPIELGVVGHRDIGGGAEVREELRGKLVRLFKQFLKAYPSTPLLVVSSLAEGADQIAARAALEAGAFVRAPLPFPRESYRESTSFDTEAGKRELDALLDHPKVESYVVPLPAVTDDLGVDWARVATERADGPAKLQRQTCYATAGGHTARRCHVRAPRARGAR